MSHLGRRLSALIDGELDEADRDRVLTHLAGCDPCRREASALRMLKRRMNSLGGGLPDGDPDLTHRLMSLASASLAFGDPQSRDTAWLWPAAFPVAVTGPRELRLRRTTVAGAVAFLVVGLGAAAFAAGGGGDGVPGPSVTPAVDVFMLQHELITGETPVEPAVSQVVKFGPSREP